VSDAVDLIQRVNAAIASADLDAVAEHVHPDAVWEHNIGAGTLEEGVYRGRDSVIRLLERVVEPWVYLRAEPTTIEDLGDGRYLVRGELHAKHAATAAEIVSPYEQQLEFRDGVLVRGQMTSRGLAA
jgi:ketosteroid isomerase-like protein